MKLYSSAIILLFCLSTGNILGQDKTSLHYAEQIDSSKLYTTLSKLASDEFEGRGTGEKGGKMTTDYLAEYLKNSGVPAGNKGSYFQDMGASIRDKGKKRFEFGNFDYVDDYSYENQLQDDSIIHTDRILFVGYGQYSVSYNDFSSFNITDQVIMMLDGEPSNKFGVEYAKRNKSDEYIKKMKPKAVIKVREGFNSFSHYAYRNTVFANDQRRNDYTSIRINEGLANKLLEPTGKTVKQIAYETEKTGASPSGEFEANITFSGDYFYEKCDAFNVIAYIEGSDLKDEYVVICAHHDHEGLQYGRVYNGADDNASGVSSALEIARVLAKAKKEGKGPRRSIVILLPTAEEKGLLGSKFYINQPVFPLEKTVTCINLDMLGRVSNDYKEKGNHYVYLVNHKEKSGTLPQLLEKINETTLGLTIDYKHTSPGDGSGYFSRSDQYNFADKGIPSIMLTSGEHEDYHRHTDDTERIDFNGLLKRTKLAFLLVWDAANTADTFAEEKVKVRIGVADVKGTID